MECNNQPNSLFNNSKAAEANIGAPKLDSAELRTLNLINLLYFTVKVFSLVS
jgi:hypothetical protein